MVLNMNTYVVPASLERERERQTERERETERETDRERQREKGPDFVLGKHLSGMWAKFCNKLIFLTP